MELYRDKDFEDELVNKVVSNWDDKVREDIHLSDLISPRKAFFNKTAGRAPTKDDIFTFIVGLGVEKKLGSLLGEPHAPTEIRHGIHFSPDFRLPDITELKSRRRSLAKDGEESDYYSYYLRQLVGYLALTGETNGNLLVFSIAEKFDESNKTRPELAAYRVRCTEEELKNALEELLRIRDLLTTALTDNDYTRLPVCEDWLCGRSIREVKEAPRCITCARDFATDYLLKRHKDGKKTSDHEVKYGIYTYSFEPTCKYYDICGRTVNE